MLFGRLKSFKIWTLVEVWWQLGLQSCWRPRVTSREAALCVSGLLCCSLLRPVLARILGYKWQDS